MKKTSNPISIQSDYLNCIFYPSRLTDVINRMATKIKSFQKKNKFDAIAFTGISGAAVAYPLSYKLKIPLICIRKAMTSHFEGAYEGRTDINNYIIVDDFISTGATIKRIQKQIKLETKYGKLIAVFLYNDTARRRGYSYKSSNYTVFSV